MGRIIKRPMHPTTHFVGRVKLTFRERQVLRLIADDLINKQIAHRLGMSEGSIKVYICLMKTKISAIYPDVQTRLGMALWYKRFEDDFEMLEPTGGPSPAD